MCSSKNHGGLSLTSIKKNEMNNQETCICPNDECGRAFDHPVQLTVLSSDPVETYPACPYCMSRIETREEEQELTKEAPIALKIKTALQKERERGNEEPEEPSAPRCVNGFGYLKKRPKGASIPDECLVCQKMIQCLSS
jgi:DNA-directed RNA polymerase subunit RPC12/RpoP